MATFIAALALAIPIILFPVALVWYINISGMAQAAQAAKRRRPARETMKG